MMRCRSFKAPVHVDVHRLTSVNSSPRDVTNRPELLMLLRWPSAPDVTWLLVNMQVTACHRTPDSLERERLIAQQVVVSVCSMVHKQGRRFKVKAISD